MPDRVKLAGRIKKTLAVQECSVLAYSELSNWSLISESVWLRLFIRIDKKTATI